jgi:hypothetical protein
LKTVSPAAASASPQASWVCAPAGFNSLDALGGAVLSTARGGQAREPVLDEIADGASTRSYNPQFTANVPVWVHVITPDGTTGNVSAALINDQIAVLNNT